MPARWRTRITEAGGTVLMPPMEIGSFGSMAVVTDPTGAVFGLWQSGENTGVDRVDEPGALTWNEVMVGDYQSGMDFYSKVFGFTYKDLGDGLDYSTVELNGKPVAGVGTAAMVGDGVPPHWRTYFSVADAAETCAKVTELGGTVVAEPWETPFGLMAELTGPAGETFLINQSPADPPPAPPEWGLGGGDQLVERHRLVGCMGLAHVARTVVQRRDASVGVEPKVAPVRGAVRRRGRGAGDLFVQRGHAIGQPVPGRQSSAGELAAGPAPPGDGGGGRAPWRPRSVPLLPVRSGRCADPPRSGARSGLRRPPVGTVLDHSPAWMRPTDSGYGIGKSACPDSTVALRRVSSSASARWIGRYESMADTPAYRARRGRRDPAPRSGRWSAPAFPVITWRLVGSGMMQQRPV